jgi:hypothetical protein
MLATDSPSKAQELEAQSAQCVLGVDINPINVLNIAHIVV